MVVSRARLLGILGLFFLRQAWKPEGGRIWWAVRGCKQQRGDTEEGEGGENTGAEVGLEPLKEEAKGLEGLRNHDEAIPSQ